MAINNEPGFQGKRLLFLSGERRQESAARSKYAEMEQHRTHTKSRHVDHWRMVIDWTEEEVWPIMREFNIMPHPACRLSWSRVSCLACIFGQADQWASVRLIAPDLFNRIVQYERDFGRTIHRGKTVVDLANRGTPYPECHKPEIVALAMGRDYPPGLALTDNWTLPPGAFKHCGGPS
jgi:3'-phosphoadenosine 5'-phosphosulfate sulfotransferase (PAPS reductase)/FAD synthetase